MNANGFYQIDNAFLSTYGPKIGLEGIAVYNVLLAHADSDGLCWPSLNGIAKLVGCSRQRILRVMEKLEEAGILQRERHRGEDQVWDNTRYLLLYRRGCSATGQPLSAVILPPGPPADNRGPVADTNKTHVTRPNKDEDIQRCTPARPSSPSPPKPATPTDPLIAAVALACPRASIGSAASGKAIAWLKQHGKSPEWVAGFAEWFAAEHDDWDNPQPNPSQLIGAAEAYDAWLDAEAEELRRRREQRARLQADTAARQAELEQAKARIREAFEARFGPADQVDWKALIAAKRAEREAAEAAEPRRSVPVWQIPAMVKRYGGGADA